MLGENFIVILFGERYIDSAIPFKIYLLLLPIRVALYGPALIALGKNKIIMTRTMVELMINLIISIILINFFGYAGVAFGTVISIYIWTVPFNLYEIGKGFDTPIHKVMPYKKLFEYFIISLLASPIIFGVQNIIYDGFIIQFVVSFFIYFPFVFFVFYKKGFLKLGSIISKSTR